MLQKNLIFFIFLIKSKLKEATRLQTQKVKKVFENGKEWKQLGVDGRVLLLLILFKLRLI